MAVKSEKPKEGAAIAFLFAYDEFKRLHVGLKKERTQKDYIRMMELYYLPEFRHRSLESITPRQLSKMLDEINDRPGEQWHAIAVGRTFFQFCVRRHHIPASPMNGMQLVKNRPRDRVLSDTELKAIWNATADGKTFSNIVRLLILTGQRRGEISSLQKSWIGENEITLPKEITKNGREHRFPIGSMATSVLSYAISASEKGEAFVFPARGRTNVSFNGWNKSKAALDKTLGAEFAPWVLHDARRSYATIHARLGTPIHVIERLLNHTSGQISGVAAIYNRHTYFDEMRLAVDHFEHWFVEHVL